MLTAFFYADDVHHHVRFGARDVLLALRSHCQNNPDEYGSFEINMRVFASKLSGVLNPECHEDRLQTPEERESVKLILDRILDVYPADDNAITVIQSLCQKYLSTSSADRHALFKKRNSSFNQVKNAHDALLRENKDLKRKVSILTTDKNSLEDQLVEINYPPHIYF